ncbi:hypothetical protein WR25_24068 isoform C [Diploscapter pachys]|uniref:Uncharacterized protein n=1 Tax=Diploscapter pachys TaxID=2018661 RepID=A0A2A2K8C5_9BILA|nr:hypothetical protein WR25_24068 isoform A [Diploscapter pachys]PAV70141.1 hypothetical protein WR25_24068 isoform B [Diploscapter pachys]PAV70142.1 hypothetical protein WR25_24068 isoform C [Diploscapter pachys]
MKSPVDSPKASVDNFRNNLWLLNTVKGARIITLPRHRPNNNGQKLVTKPLDNATQKPFEFRQSVKLAPLNVPSAATDKQKTGDHRSSGSRMKSASPKERFIAINDTNLLMKLPSNYGIIEFKKSFSGDRPVTDVTLHKADMSVLNKLFPPTSRHPTVYIPLPSHFFSTYLEINESTDRFVF